jgi:hypothetical protein
MMNTVTISENSRYILSDLESLYDLPASVDQAVCYINEHTHFTRQNHDVHLFFNLDQYQFTMGIPVLGVPQFDISEHQNRFYLEDYEQVKIFRTELSGVNLINDGGEKISEALEQKIEALFESKSARPEVVRLIFKNWSERIRNPEESLLLVDFFLD